MANNVSAATNVFTKDYMSTDSTLSMSRNSRSSHNRTGVCSAIFRNPWKEMNCNDNVTINTHNTHSFFCHKNKPVIDVFDTLQSVGSTSGATRSWQDHLVRRAKEAVQGERCLLLVRVIICSHSDHKGPLRPHGPAVCSHGPPDYQTEGKITSNTVSENVSVAIFLYLWVCVLKYLVSSFINVCEVPHCAFFKITYS